MGRLLDKALENYETGSGRKQPLLSGALSPDEVPANATPEMMQGMNHYKYMKDAEMQMMDPGAQPGLSEQQLNPGNFDPQGNPKDKQSLKDMYDISEPLAKLDDESRAQAWPKIAQKLVQDNPKLEAVLRPDQVPTQDQLMSFRFGEVGGDPGAMIENTGGGQMDIQQASEAGLGGMRVQDAQAVGLMKRGPNDYNPAEDAAQQAAPSGAGGKSYGGGVKNVGAASFIGDDQAKADQEELDFQRKLQLTQEKEAASGKKSKKGGDNGAGFLTGPTRNKIQKELIDGQKDFQTVKDIYNNMDYTAFTVQGGLKGSLAVWKDKMDLATPEEKKLITSRKQQSDRIGRLMLAWRKSITGVAGGEKEMADIERRTLNDNLSPTQAKAALEDMILRMTRDRLTKEALLQEGISFDGSNGKQYSGLFNKKKASIYYDLNEGMRKMKKANPKVGYGELMEEYLKLRRAGKAQR